MVKTITQETYDEVVRENMEEFSMAPEEAISDAVKQFEMQGVDLSNIVKDLAMANPASLEAIKKAVKILEALNKAKSTNNKDYIRELDVLKTECDKGLNYRVIAGKEGSYNVILDSMLSHEDDSEVTLSCLKSMISLMTVQPDLLNQTGVDLMIRYLDKQKDQEILHFVLKWIKECCIKHEHNRQQIFNTSILAHLKPLLNDADATLLRDVCAILRSLVLDDDIRVEFGKAHEHARVIAGDTLCPIIELLEKFKTDEAVVSDLLLTLSALIVRNEYCKKVEDAGGLNFVLEVLKDFLENEKLNRQALKLIKVLAGNDECKMHIIQKGGAVVIANSISTHKDSAQTVIYGLNTIAALSLRSPENSKIMFESGFPELIIECMMLHPENMNVQKTSSWAIRNMVSRSRNQNEKFITLGVEPLLQAAMKKFQKDCEYDIKAALRDLGCEVDFKEEWTGKGGKLTTQATRS